MLCALFPVDIPSALVILIKIQRTRLSVRTKIFELGYTRTLLENACDHVLGLASGSVLVAAGLLDGAAAQHSPQTPQPRPLVQRLVQPRRRPCSLLACQRLMRINAGSQSQWLLGRHL
ncbi:hypothetical protein BDV93DRAFT_181155 [Ceratobasidium sp. AG-I]|nr:hypothetical protein BDV93DRAFT_181155 [Ceratobasidium sp. AG-I]